MSDVTIYCIRNIENGKEYIGSTNNYERRKKRHIYDLEREDHHNIHLQRAYHKYGEDSFEFEVLEECEKDNQLEREQHWMDKRNVVEEGYNISGQADKIEMTDEVVEKIREGNKGKDMTEEAINKLKRIHKKNAEENRDELISRLPDGDEISGEDHPMWGKDNSHDEVTKRKFREEGKLNVEAVKVIKYFLKNNQAPPKELANKYNVSLSTIYDIDNNRTWSDITI